MTYNLKILDTTLRDGSYVVNFNFTAQDTEKLCRALDQLGIGLIEVGHGVGINAGARVAPAAATDVGYVKAARRGVTKAAVAMFCIPGIALLDHMNACIEAGLQIVRVGIDITERRAMEPFILEARRRGCVAYANLMKSYLLPATEFACVAHECESMGAEAIFLVDSAGGMMPEEVRSCVEEMRSATGLPLGFHGHNNLGLAVANCFAAIEAGATIVDTTLMGIGRSSGNPPTELMIALLQRRYEACRNVDAILAMELAEAAVGRIARTAPVEGPVVNILGLAQVHSSYLPVVTAAAAKAKKQLFDTIQKVGSRDRAKLSLETLNNSVAEARSTEPLEERLSIAGLASDLVFQKNEIAN